MARSELARLVPSRSETRITGVERYGKRRGARRRRSDRSNASENGSVRVAWSGRKKDTPSERRSLAAVGDGQASFQGDARYCGIIYAYGDFLSARHKAQI